MHRWISLKRSTRSTRPVSVWVPRCSKMFQWCSNGVPMMFQWCCNDGWSIWVDSWWFMLGPALVHWWGVLCHLWSTKPCDCCDGISMGLISVQFFKIFENHALAARGPLSWGEWSFTIFMGLLWNFMQQKRPGPGLSQPPDRPTFTELQLSTVVVVKAGENVVSSVPRFWTSTNPICAASTKIF